MCRWQILKTIFLSKTTWMIDDYKIQIRYIGEDEGVNEKYEYDVLLCCVVKLVLLLCEKSDLFDKCWFDE